MIDRSRVVVVHIRPFSKATFKHCLFTVTSIGGCFMLARQQKNLPAPY